MTHFILWTNYRMETLSFTKKSTRAKFFGTIVSVIGALVVTLYKGPKLIWSLTPSPSQSPTVSLSSSQSNWALGGLFLTSEYILVPLWYIVLVLVQMFVFILYMKPDMHWVPIESVMMSLKRHRSF